MSRCEAFGIVRMIAKKIKQDYSLRLSQTLNTINTNELINEYYLLTIIYKFIYKKGYLDNQIIYKDYILDYLSYEGAEYVIPSSAEKIHETILNENPEYINISSDSVNQMIIEHFNESRYKARNKVIDEQIEFIESLGKESIPDWVLLRYLEIKRRRVLFINKHWNLVWLPFLINMLSCLKMKKEKLKEIEQRRLTNPQKCCYCMRGQDDFNYTYNVAGRSFLIWLVERHERYCIKRPCNMSLLSEDLILKIFEYLVDRRQFGKHQERIFSLTFLQNN